ncbi:MAG TPA: hypothetical protein VK623_03260 [Flavobacterium sp.]|nr:hypothetical protein [Flavobacterium sp.]
MKNYLLFLIFFMCMTASAQNTPEEKTYRTTEVDIKPDLKNGMYTLRMFVSQNFNIPAEIKNKKITVFTSFIIEPDGMMTDEKSFYISVKDYMPADVVAIQTEEQKAAESKLYDAMKVEAARVLSLFNESWIPAQIGGKPVKCLYNYPISFNIE